MKRLLIIFSLLLSTNISAQIKELRAPKKDNLESFYVDSLNRLFAVCADKDSTAIFLYDSLNASWFYSGSVQMGSQNDLVSIQSISGWNGAAYISGVKDNDGYAVMYYNQGNWTKLAKMYKYNLFTKNQFLNKFYRFKSEIYFVTNADSVSGFGSQHVFKVTPGGLVNLNFNVKANEYHMTLKDDTLLLGANNRIYYYSSPSWNTYSIISSNSLNYISGLEYKFGRLYYSQRDAFLKIRYPSFVDSIPIDAPSKLSVVGQRLYLSPFAGQAATDIKYYDSSQGLRPAFRIKGTDSLPMQIATNGKRAYVYFQSNKPVIFGNVNMGRVAELEVSNYSIDYLDRLFLLPFLDHNRNTRHDVGEQIVSVNFYELDGARVFTNAVGNVYEYLAYDNEYICFKAEERIQTDSCYALTFSGAKCGRHYKTPDDMDTLYFPYQNDYQEAISNVKVKVLASRNCRLDVNVPGMISLRRDDCQSNFVSGSVELTIPNNAVASNFSTPYKTKVGNVYTFDFNLGNSYTLDIKFDLMYPYSNFSYGMVEYVKATIIGTTNEVTEDNIDSAEHRLKYSFDPNAKICVPEGRVTIELKSIRFHIDFQNEGNDYAQRVVVVDSLNLNIPVYEFKMIGASHKYKLSHKDNVITWTFDDINLWPKAYSEIYSKGYVEFEAKVKGVFRVGDSITNTAAIYFDKNEPIITNRSKVERVTRLDRPEKLDILDIYPNPVNETLHIYNKTNERIIIHIYDAQGKEMSSFGLDAIDEMTINASEWSPGVYMIYIEGYGAYCVVR